jgi:hypothetical protein
VEKQDTGSILHIPHWTLVPFQGLDGYDPFETPSQWWTRQSMRTSSIQSQVTAEDIRTKIYRPTQHHTLPWTAPKTTPKAKRKAIASEFRLQTNHVIIQNLLYRLLLHLLFIQARRTGFAALKWQAILGKTSLKYSYSYSNLLARSLLCLAFTLGPELACSGGMGGREIL